MEREERRIIKNNKMKINNIDIDKIIDEEMEQLDKRIEQGLNDIIYRIVYRIMRDSVNKAAKQGIDTITLGKDLSGQDVTIKDITTLHEEIIEKRALEKAKEGIKKWVEEDMNNWINCVDEKLERLERR